MSDVATLHAILVAGVLAVAGIAKLADPSLQRLLAGSPLLKLVRSEALVFRFVQSVAIVEVALALAILMLPNMILPRAGAGVVLLGSAFYGAWSMRIAPDAPCGCFGSVSRTPVSWRTLTRAGLLSVAALVASIGTTSLALPTAPLPWLIFGGETVVLAALSPELVTMKRWLSFGRRLPRCFYSDEPAAVTLQRLQRSPLWPPLHPYLTTVQPDDRWLESCWRLFSFPAQYEDRIVAAVVALKLPPGKLYYRAALVDEETKEVLVRLDADEPRWRSFSLFARRFATAQ